MKTTIGAGNFAIVRSPLLPISVFQEWKQSEDADDYILALYDNPLVDEALYISSMSLHARLQELRRGEGEAAKYKSERKKLVASLAKFISRAAYRCTPFGLFAQVQLAHIKNQATGNDFATRQVRRGIHLDGAIETRLIEKCLADYDLRENLQWQISSTAFIHCSHLSYVDWVYQTNWQRTYRSVELSLNDALLVLKNECQEPRSFSEICALLTSDPDISYEEAREFIHEIISRRLLLPILAASCSNHCSFDASLEKASQHPAFQALREIQVQLHQARSKADSTESLVPEYEAIYQTTEKLLGSKNLSLGVVQIDSLLPDSSTINKKDADNLASAVQLIAAHCSRQGSVMRDYKALFRERFEDREINLAYAMHPELGLPYPDKGWLDSPLLDGLRLGGGEMGVGGPSTSTLYPLDKYLIKVLFEHAKNPTEVIRISAADLEKLPATSINKYTFAEGLYAHVNAHPTKADQDPILEIRHIGGRNGLELIARFTHLSPEMTTCAQEYYREYGQRDADCIYAEIIHHPQDRILNIIRKPRLSEHDIVFAGASDLPRSQQFWLEDLTIQLKGERFVLRDRKTGKQVIPRLTSAHNYGAKQLGTYQFLAMLQDDDSPWIGFNWPQAVEDFDYLPRLEIEGVVVARARWTLSKEDISALNIALVDEKLEEWRTQRKLPRFISLDQGDNHLPVDLENIASANLLLDEIIKLPSTHVFENLSLSLAEENHLWSKHTQEWIMPLHLQMEASEIQKTIQAAPKNIASEGKICANFDEWVYLRIYTGTGYADRVLRDCLAPVMREAQQSGLIDKWFFIRYKDQFEHVRLRFHSPHQADLMATLVQLQARLKLARQDGLLWRIQTDDYVLEEERYAGKEGLALCEELFRLDSEDVLRLLEIEEEYQGDHARWVYAIASVDHYAQRLCPATPIREKLLDSLAESFLNEHSSTNTRSTIIVALGGRFRDMRKQFDALKNGTPALNAWGGQLQQQAPARDAILEQLRVVLSNLSEEKQLGVWQSLMHMHCNRLAPSDPRRHETVLYDFAKRLERARQAKQRNTQQVQA